MAINYLFDTNAVIDFLAGNFPVSATNWTEKTVDNNEVAVSIINKIEVLGFNASSSELALLTEFIDAITVLTLSDEVADKTIDIRRMRKIKLPDAIIAATALVHDLTLVSRNDGDFKSIPNLKYLNPFTDI